MFYQVRRGLITNRGAIDATVGGGGGGAVKTYRDANNNSVNPHIYGDGTTTVALGPDSADRRVIVAVDGQGGLTSVTSVQIGSAPSVGPSLTQRVFDNASGTAAPVGIFDGLITSGGGFQIVTVTWNTGSFLDRNVYIWTATGLTTGYVSSGFHNGVGTGSISVNAGDFIFAVQRMSSVGNWSGSTNPPDHTPSANVASTGADFTASGTGTFVLDPGGGGQDNMAFAVYR